MATPSTRSPLRLPPLRVAGQSIQEEIDRVADKAMDHIGIVMVLFMGWLVFLASWVFNLPALTMFIVFSTYLVLALVWSLPRLIRLFRQLGHLRLGRDGERIVAENLEPLKAAGHTVIHDLIGPGFNVDHVVVGPTGVYTIETKTRSKPIRGNPKVYFDGQELRVGGFAPDRDPVTQAHAQARWLQGIVRDMTGRTFPVKPVIVFPGWFVERTTREASSQVWVLEPKALPKFIANEPARLAEEDAAMITDRLRHFVRAVVPK